jgi:glycosyltransferase involved in cell wall biosynthesis
MVLRALYDASRLELAKFELTIIGVERDVLVRAVPELEGWLEHDVDVTGPLAADAAADRLTQHDFLLAYFQDGVSGRRGSLLAALCEGLPVVTTFDDSSDEVFCERPFVKLLSCDEASFRAELHALLAAKDRPFSEIDRRDVRRFYDEHFSWGALIKRYLTLSGFERASELVHAPRLPNRARQTPG